MDAEGRELSSFRDPAGFLYRRDGVLLRQVNACHKREFDAFKESGLEKKLLDSGLLIPAPTVGLELAQTKNAIAVLQPQILPFISYPYEWSFHALKDAATATLDIQRIALDHGMTLRDASAYNIQFLSGKPVLIDSLSFGIYEEGKPWFAYRQFCQHFLAPLVLMSSIDPSLGRLSQVHLDGIPLDLASKLAPKSRWNLGLGIHLHTHAKTMTRSATGERLTSAKSMSKHAMLAWIDSLESTVRKIEWQSEKTTWSGYYGETNYSSEAMAHKKTLVQDFLEEIPSPATCWDLGANTGEFSELAAMRGAHTVSWDFDHACVDANYLKVKGAGKNILPLILDLTNPSPAIGWAGEERRSLEQRGPADVLLALAIVHHLALGNNLPFEKIAEFFARVGKWAIVEFVPKDDSQALRLIENRQEVFADYSIENFEQAFTQRFDIQRKALVEGSSRTLYLMRKKS